MASVDRPEILLLSLVCQPFFDESYSALIDKLHESAKLKRVKAADAAIRYLEGNNPRVVLVTDEGLTEPENKAVLEKLVSYVRNGGLAIVGLHFPNFTTMDAFDDFFGAFDLPWKRGDYHRTDFEFHPSCVLPAGATSSSFPAPYSMKVLHVRNARPHEKIFIPVHDAQTQSLVFTPASVDQAQAAVVGATVGNGYLAYIGDVNSQDGSDRVMASLCGL
ncbi:triacylglycerol lipase protein [Rutstroemia sp. NJR-2017a BVV2]|nr:triacylglycerol lipase protein [Rutstroemia sp. NJR-2017a BVV2]